VTLALAPAALVLAACLIACDADTASDKDGATQRTPTAPVTSGPETGDLIAHGTVLDQGKPVSGAEVVVSLWPETDDMEVGQSFSLWDSEKATTDSDGDWFLQLDPDTIPSKFWPSGEEFLNIDLRIIDAPRTLSWSTTVYSVGERKVWRTEGARAGDPVLDVDVDLGREKITRTDSRGDSETSDAPIAKMRKK
jgi:hypothetical protein